MHKEVEKYLALKRKQVVLEYAQDLGNVVRACREFQVPRSSFYRWRKAFLEEGEAGLVRKKPIAKSHPRHNQKNAILFMDYVIEKFPFRIHTVRTARGYEFQAQFHWHVEDKGIRHVYIKPRSPQLNGKVERSHRTDREEFHQLLTYTDDVDLNTKLEEWEHFYNMNRPHGAHGGKTPYEALRCLLK